MCEIKFADYAFPTYTVWKYALKNAESYPFNWKDTVRKTIFLSV